MYEITVHITIKIPEAVTPDQLTEALTEAIEDAFVMDGFEGAELLDIEL